MHLRYILILIITVNISFSQTKFVERKYNGGTEKGNLDVEGLQTGLWQRFYSNGNIYEEINFLKGKYNGQRKEYYNKGQVKVISSYIDNKLDGDWLSFYENGTKQSEGKYINGERNGTYKEYYENGNLEKIQKYYDKGGRTNYIRKYDENGKVVITKDLNEKGDGVYEVIRDDESIRIREVYKNHNRISETDFYESGIRKKQDIHGYENPKDNSWLQKEYDKAGKLRIERLLYPAKESYKKVFGDSIQELYHYAGTYYSGYFESHYYNGNIAEQGSYRANFKDGLWKTFYKDGKLKFIGKFVSKNPQLKDSTHTYYYPDGQIEKIEHYQIVESKNVRGVFSNQNAGSWKTYYKNGNLKEQTDYPEISNERNDLPRKHFVYFENGKLKQEESILQSGRLSGVCKTYFENGILASEINYYGGKKDGKATEYFENGKIKFSGLYTWDEKNAKELIYYYQTSSEKKAKRVTYNEQGRVEELFYPDGKKMAELTYTGNDKNYKDIKVFNASGKMVTLNEFASVDKNFKVKDCVMLYDQTESVIDLEIEFQNEKRSYTFNKTFK